MRRVKGNKLKKFFFRCWYSAQAILFADNMILNNIGRNTIENRVNLHWWDSRIEMGDETPFNLGDNLSEVIVSYMLSNKGLSLNTPIQGKKHLYAVGSIIPLGFQNATIWGSGFLHKLDFIRLFFNSPLIKKLDIRAVRGPKSREQLIRMGHKCPEVYGDPAMLLPMIYSPQALRIDGQLNEYIIIPHFTKEEECREKYGDDIVVSMMTLDYKHVIDRMLSAKKVITGSLHGIIIAETYGVPAVFLRTRGAYKDFKYDDYYASTGRPDYIYASTIEEAIEMEPMPLPTNIKELQKGLIDSFPYDLWKNK